VGSLSYAACPTPCSRVAEIMLLTVSRRLEFPSSRTLHVTVGMTRRKNADRVGPETNARYGGPPITLPCFYRSGRSANGMMINIAS